MKRVLTVHEIANGYLIEFNTGKKLRSEFMSLWGFGSSTDETTYRYAASPAAAANDVETILAAPSKEQVASIAAVSDSDDD